jgi:hypothetical protein
MHKLGKLAATAGLLAAALVAAAATSPAPAARAAASTGCTAYYVRGPDEWAGQEQCSEDGSPGTSGGRGSASACVLETLAAAFGTNSVVTKAYKAPPGYIYLLLECNGTIGNFAINLFADGGTLTPQDLASQAYARLSPPGLAVGTAPPSHRMGLVGLPEWFWMINRADYKTMKQTVGLAGLSATVIARPGPLVINPGDGQHSFSCPGPGTPYYTSEPAASQQSDCTHLYTRPSSGQPGNAYSVSVSVTWTATWTSSDGAGGTLKPIIRTTTIELSIAQAQALFSGE